MVPMIRIGPAALQTLYIVWIVGLWLGIEAASRAGRRRNLPPGFIDSAIFWALAAGLVAARLAFVLEYPAAYREDMLGLISPQPEALNGAVGLVVGVGVFGWLAWREGLPARPLLDALAPGVGIMLAALALAAFAEGTHVGAPADVPWAVELWDARRHPVQLYVALPVLAAVAGIWWWRGTRPFAGFDALLVGGVVALAMLVSSRWAESSVTVIDAFRREQVIAWAVLLAIALLGAWWSRSGPAKPYNLVADDADAAS